MGGDARPLHFVVDQSGTAVEQAIDVVSEDTDPLYVQGLSGVNVSFDLSDLFKLDDPFVNYAELEVFIAEQSFEDTITYPIPERLTIQKINSAGQLEEIADVRNARLNNQVNNFFGGGFSEGESGNTLSYRMNITSHVKRIFRGEESSTIILSIFDKVENANRVLLNGPSHPDFPAKLKLTYTED